MIGFSRFIVAAKNFEHYGVINIRRDITETRIVNIGFGSIFSRLIIKTQCLSRSKNIEKWNARAGYGQFVQEISSWKKEFDIFTTHTWLKCLYQ